MLGDWLDSTRNRSRHASVASARNEAFAVEAVLARGHLRFAEGALDGGCAGRFFLAVALVALVHVAGSARGAHDQAVVFGGGVLVELEALDQFFGGACAGVGQA